jgi:hypothetical protein
MRIARRIDKSDFKDFHDKEWSVLEPEKEIIGKLLSKPAFLFAVIWAMVQDQAEKKFEDYRLLADNREPGDTFPISPKDAEAAELEFVSGVNGPTIDAARSAFMEALSDFFPDQRTGLSALLTQYKTMTEKAGKLMEKSVPLLNELLDQELDQQVEILKERLKEELGKKHGETSTPLPVQPESVSMTSVA